MSDKGTLRLVAEHLGTAFGDLGRLFADADAAQTTLRRLGWLFDPVPQDYLDLAATAASIASKVSDSRNGSGDNLALIKEIFNLIGVANRAFKTLPAPPGVDTNAFLAEFPERLISLVVVDYLVAHVPTLYQGLVQLGIVKVFYHPQVDAADGTVIRPASVERKIVYSEIPALLSDPASIPKRVYGWGTPNFQFDLLARPLAELLNRAGLLAFAEGVHPELRERLQPDLQPAQNMRTFVRVSFMDGLIGNTPVNLSVALVDAPIEPGHPLPGLAIVPLLPAISEQIPIGANTVITVKGGIDVANTFGLFIRPKETPELRFPFVAGGGIPTAGVAADITFAPPTPSVLLGQAQTTRLEAKGAKLGVSFLEERGEIEVKAEAFSSFAIVVDSGDGDGFLGKILEGVGADGLNAEFTAGLRWSNRTGFSFVGGGGFELQLTPNKTLGPITLQTLDISLKAGAQNGPPALVAGVGAGISVKIGPVTAAVESIGVNLKFQFVEGNAGPFNVDVGFKPPTGVGIAVNGGPVSGGGFLSFEDGRYSGALALSVYAISVKAFGIIDTKFPDGHRGFSFIIIISAEFTPIQLGFGFTLNGVGGILGINRDLNEEALRNAVMRGSMGNVLFPKDPIKDAPSILHDIAELFPPADGHFAFGPMAILAWGTPAIIEARLGIVIVFPGPRIALLGTVQVLLPPGTGAAAPEKRLVEIHLDIAGLLDFPKKHFALDAKLHNSNVVGFPISGEMAARIDWGQNQNLLIAMGGFHPHFKPPAGFPKLRRMAIDLGISGNPSATLSGYMALTSNTAQVGAALDVTATGGGARLKGGLAFDALIVFSPFSFEASLEGGVHVDFHGAGFGMHFHGHISGPAPWHLKGDVCVSILWWDACVGFSVTLGGEHKPELPAIDVWAGSLPDAAGIQEVPGLERAIAAPGNWAGVLPPNGYQAVSIRQTDSSAASRVDPLGVATFQQKVLPFKLAISKFAGRDRPKNDPVTVTVNKVLVDGDNLTAMNRVNPLSDSFAPAQYQKLPDAQALSSPSFQPMQAGFSVSSADLTNGTQKTKTIVFQTFVVGNPDPAPEFPVNDNMLLAMVDRGASAQGGLRTGNIDRFVDFAKPVPTFAEEAYALASKTTLKRFTTAADDAAYALTADKLAALPQDVRATLQIVPIHELAAAA